MRFNIEPSVHRLKMQKETLSVHAFTESRVSALKVLVSIWCLHQHFLVPMT